jgi:cholesterol transport system auxiliary component
MSYSSAMCRHLSTTTSGGVVVLGLLLLQGCALLSKGDAMSPRYFSPALEPVRDSPQAGARPLELRIGQIEPAAHLSERIAYRVSDTELAYYDDRRWTESPEQFVRRALESELFETQAFRRVVSGDAATLDVEVLSFEELRAPERARLSLLITLRDQRHARFQRTILAEVPLDLAGKDDAGPALAKAMQSALARATKEIAERVSAELSREPAASSVAATND